MTIRKACPCGRVVGFREGLSPRCVCGRRLLEQPDYQGGEIKYRPPLGLGDRVERRLSRLGITQQWYRTVKQRFGLMPTCGCDKRKAWLNRVGRWWQGVGAKHDARIPHA